MALRLRNTLCTLALLGILGFHLGQLWVPNPIARYPDLYWIANNTMSFFMCALMSVYGHVKMYELAC